jgi:1,5-anhydro-D-fructose reductase (1,5-anhydro-D-mannitol-forming)
MAFGWGIVSTGKHPDVKIAPAITAAPGAELVAVYSRDQGRADAFAAAHGARAAYGKLADLLADSRVDGVVVCSPNALHAEHVVQAAQAGKHVLCEKPMATAIADAVAMVQACQRAGVTFGVAFNLRQHPGHIRAREIVAAGALGRVVLAQGQWAFGVRGRDGAPPRTELTRWWDTPELIGGASTMMGTGVHVVDLMRFVLGQEIAEIAAVTDGQTGAKPLEQIACLTLRFSGGTLGQVTASRLLPDSRNDFRVYGILGRLEGHASLWEARTGRFEVVSETVNESAEYPEALLPNYVAEIEDMQRAVAEGRPPAATGIDGLRAVEATVAMIESARTGRTVKVARTDVGARAGGR